MVQLRLTKEARIECHIHKWENGQQGHGPGNLSGAISHTAGTDPDVEAGEYDDAGELDGECEEDGTAVERAAAPSDHGNVPIQQIGVICIRSLFVLRTKRMYSKDH